MSTIAKMRCNNSCSCISRRNTSICAGVLTTILWAAYAYYLAITESFTAYPWNFEYNVFNVGRTSAFPTFIASLASSALSVLMVFGVIRRIANYIFPWLAIHFAFLVYAITLSLYAIIICMLIKINVHSWENIPAAIFLTGIVTFSWRVVYLYCKSLII